MPKHRKFLVSPQIGLATWMAVGLLTFVGADYAEGCRMKNPDLSVYGIKLTDGESATKQVGAGPDLVEDDDDLPHARFVSKDGAQELILFSHYGAGPDEYAEAEVRPAGTEALTLKELPTEAFVTGRGIALGMTLAEVVDRLGSCRLARERSGALETLHYVVAGADTDPELKGFGYATYYAEYQFRSGKLMRFRFGFEYP
jgi:hypothetical protein